MVYGMLVNTDQSDELNCTTIKLLCRYIGVADVLVFFPYIYRIYDYHSQHVIFLLTGLELCLEYILVYYVYTDLAGFYL